MAGMATLEVKFEDKKIDGRSTYILSVKGNQKARLIFFIRSMTALSHIWMKNISSHGCL